MSQIVQAVSSSSSMPSKPIVSLSNELLVAIKPVVQIADSVSRAVQM